jgi:Uma2 family endonuclease
MPLPAAKRHATYEDVLRVPEHLVGELVEGELFASPRPALRHARAAGRLGAALDSPFDRGRGGPGGWVILPEPELHLGGNVLVPDLAGWRRERMREIPDESATGLAPDWICEIVSPSTEAFDRSVKMPRYAEAEVGFAWLIDPRAKTLEIYALRAGSWHLRAQHAGGEAIRGEPFAAVELDLSPLWAL